MKKYIFIFIFFSTGITLSAQKSIRIRSNVYPDTVMVKYQNKLTELDNKYFAALDSINNDTVPERYIEPDPRYFKLFIPLTYYDEPVVRAFNPKWEPKQLENISYPTDELFPVDSEQFTITERVNQRTSKALLDVYIKYPKKVIATERQISRRRKFKKEVVEELPTKVNVTNLFKPDIKQEKSVDANYMIHKPNFWITKGSGSLQFTQNYISDNWYKGGESTNSMVSQLELNANYDDKQRIELDNKLEIKLGFITTPSDTVHKYKPNSDLLRLSSKLGIKAITNWYYTLSAEFNTQFFSNYKTNTNDKQSAFLSPANVIASIGMDFKQNKKKYNLSVVISPLAYNLRYVGNKDVDPTTFGLDAGEKFLHNFGSQLQSNLKWTIISSVVWESRISYFTNYEKVEAEWENTFNFVLNRYLSTKLFVHTRFDDGAKRKDDSSYFQLKELLSFGLNYQW